VVRRWPRRRHDRLRWRERLSVGSREHPGIIEAAVVGVDDAEFGKRLAAFVVRRDDVDADELKSYVRAHLARYKIPRDVVFVDQLPRNETGKVLRKQLVDR